jgi:hypothetical protein
LTDGQLADRLPSETKNTANLKRSKITDKEEGRMKKIICLVVVILMIAAVAYAAKKVAITTKNVASLKGTWAGVLSFATIGAAGGITSPCTLEILNDAPPLKAKLTISDVPSQVAQQFGIAPGQKVGENDDGIITADGSVMWASPDKNFINATLMDNKKLSLWYYFRGMRGDATLSKK